MSVTGQPRIIVTGASGFIGRMIVPRLRARGAKLLLVGRNSDTLREAHGAEAAICTYDDLAQHAAGYDAILNLAVMNNDQHGDLGTFRAANVELTESLVEIARQAKISTFIATSTIQALDKGAKNLYAQTKREADIYLTTVIDPRIVILQMPAVYGEHFAGKLSVLEHLPAFLRRPALWTLSMLRPVVHVDQVADTVLRIVQADAVENTEEILSDRQIDNPVYKSVIRFLDLLFAIGILLILSWLLFGLWVAVKLSSKGPGIFAQERIGKGGRPFTCYKFRTMVQNTPQRGTHEVDAIAVTPVGNLLRKTKLDELPQCWNILRNEMSLVGPRPSLPSQIELIEERRARGVLDVKGGITGWAQIRGVDMSDPKRLARTDAEYLGLRSLPFDLKIVARTFIGRGQGDLVRSNKKILENTSSTKIGKDMS